LPTNAKPENEGNFVTNPYATPLLQSDLKSLKLLTRGKVRDMYAVGDDKILIVATDRISAFDVVLPTPIPDKGRVLTNVANFWFDRTGHIVHNHLSTTTLEEALPDADERAPMVGRAVVARRLKPLPIEAIVRGYLVGSGWNDYQKTGSVSGVELPTGLINAQILPEPIFTPSTKADVGGHDENINYEQSADLIGGEIAAEVRRMSLEIYVAARGFAAEHGIIIADTKMEFGLDDDGNIVLIDELLTPDSSRFWPVSEYQVGSNPPSFDKQYIRDWLDYTGWDRKSAAPKLPDNVVAETTAKYREAEALLTGSNG